MGHRKARWSLSGMLLRLSYSNSIHISRSQPTGWGACPGLPAGVGGCLALTHGGCRMWTSDFPLLASVLICKMWQPPFRVPGRIP